MVRVLIYPKGKTLLARNSNIDKNGYTFSQDEGRVPIATRNIRSYLSIEIMRTLSQEDAERFIVESPEVERLRTCSKFYSAGPHVAGDLQHAERIRDLWRSYAIPTELTRYDVLQNFRRHTALSFHGDDGSITYEASLVEDEVAEDPMSSPQNGLPAFFGFSAHGKVCGELVYANFGMLSDFRLLESRGTSVKGKIVICKYSKVFRGLKVRAAEQFGAIGVILYNDP